LRLKQTYSLIQPPSPFGQPKSHDQLFLLGMIASMTCWGLSWTSGKILAGYGDPITISFLRFTVTFLSLPLILMAMKERWVLKKNGLRDLVIGSILLSLYTYLFFKGLVKGKAGAGGVLVTVMNPIFAYGLMLVMKRRRPTRNETIGLLLGALAGAILLRIFSDFQNIFNAGNLYFLVAAFCWAVLSIFTSRASRYGSSITFSFWMYGISTIFLLVLSTPAEIAVVISKADLKFWLNLFFSATITTSLATTFYFIATSTIGASKASSFIFMVPFTAAIGSWIFLNEVPQMNTIAGGILGIAAVYVLNRKDKEI
jgi:drug/metabolite transporter (DMT)-like permease